MLVLCVCMYMGVQKYILDRSEKRVLGDMIKDPPVGEDTSDYVLADVVIRLVFSTHG